MKLSRLISQLQQLQENIDSDPEVITPDLRLKHGKRIISHNVIDEVVFNYPSNEGKHWEDKLWVAIDGMERDDEDFIILNPYVKKN